MLEEHPEFFDASEILDLATVRSSESIETAGESSDVAAKDMDDQGIERVIYAEMQEDAPEHQISGTERTGPSAKQSTHAVAPAGRITEE